MNLRYKKGILNILTINHIEIEYYALLGANLLPIIGKKKGFKIFRVFYKKSSGIKIKEI